jgi:hypothetical protein
MKEYYKKNKETMDLSRKKNKAIVKGLITVSKYEKYGINAKPISLIMGKFKALEKSVALELLNELQAVYDEQI